MKKLFQTFLVLLAVSATADATSARQHRSIDANKLFAHTQSNRRDTDSKDLDGLYAIQAFQSNNTQQPYSEFEALYQNAIVGQTELENIVERIAFESNTLTYSSGIKSKSRALDKINTKLVGKTEQITDLARTSIVAKNVPELMDAFALLDQKTQLVRVKNRFKTPGASGYRDLSLLVRLPQSKIVAEVQLHLHAFSVVKNGKEHDNYQQIQQIERSHLADNRALTEIEQAAINKLRTESKQLYQQAWNQYLSA